MSNVVPIEKARSERNRRELADVIYSIDPGLTLNLTACIMAGVELRYTDEEIQEAVEADPRVGVIIDLLESCGYELRVKP